MRAERNISFETIPISNCQPPRGSNNNPHKSYDIREPDHPPLYSNTNVYSRINEPNKLEKWGIKFDGSRKSFSVEDFVFRVDSLQVN